MTRIKVRLAATTLGLTAAGLVWAAEPQAKPAAPAGKGAEAGIIILDGKAPAKPGAKVATGIGAGGCAACDKDGKPIADKVDKAKAAQVKPSSGK